MYIYIYIYIYIYCKGLTACAADPVAFVQKSTLHSLHSRSFFAPWGVHFGRLEHRWRTFGLSGRPARCRTYFVRSCVRLWEPEWAPSGAKGSPRSPEAIKIVPRGSQRRS